MPNHRHSASTDSDWTTASELARMGICERQVQFTQQLGARMTPAQQAAAQRGLQAHADYYAEGVWESNPSKQGSGQPGGGTSIFIVKVVATLLVLYLFGRLVARFSGA